MWVSMCFPRAVDSYFIVKKRPYSLAKIATRGVRPGYKASAELPIDRVAPALNHLWGASDLCSAGKARCGFPILRSLG